MHIDARAARSAAPGALPRLRLPRTAWWPAVLLAAALAAAFATAPPALAAQPGVTQVSADPYTPATAPTGEHATEVEPDTFAFGSTLVVGLVSSSGVDHAARAWGSVLLWASIRCSRSSRSVRVNFQLNGLAMAL